MLGMLSTGVPANAADATGSIPVGQSATQVLSTLTVGVKSDVSSDRKSHQWNKVDGKTGNYTTRDLVLERDMSNVTYNSRGNVNTGILLDHTRVKPSTSNEASQTRPKVEARPTVTAASKSTMWAPMRKRIVPAWTSSTSPSETPTTTTRTFCSHPKRKLTM